MHPDSIIHAMVPNTLTTVDNHNIEFDYLFIDYSCVGDDGRELYLPESRPVECQTNHEKIEKRLVHKF